MVRRLVAGVAVAVHVALLAAGCGSDAEGGTGDAGDRPPGRAPAVCTRASCNGHALVELGRVPDQAVSARVCVGRRCTTVRRSKLDEIPVVLPPQGQSGGPSVRRQNVTAVVRDADGAVLARGSSTVRLTAIRPNGPRCTPTCWRGEAAIELEPRR